MQESRDCPLASNCESAMPRRISVTKWHESFANGLFLFDAPPMDLSLKLLFDLFRARGVQNHYTFRKHTRQEQRYSFARRERHRIGSLGGNSAFLINCQVDAAKKIDIGLRRATGTKYFFFKFDIQCPKHRSSAWKMMEPLTYSLLIASARAKNLSDASDGCRRRRLPFVNRSKEACRSWRRLSKL